MYSFVLAQGQRESAVLCRVKYLGDMYSRMLSGEL